MIKIIPNTEENELNYYVEKHNAQILGFTDNKTLIRFDDTTDYEKLFIKTRAELMEYQTKQLNFDVLEEKCRKLKSNNDKLEKEIRKLEDYKKLMNNSSKSKISLIKEIERLKGEIRNSGQDWSGMDFMG